MAHGMVITPPCGFFFFDRSFDSSLRLCLQDWMPSLMGGTSGGFRQPTNGTASAVAGSSAAWACLLLLGLIFAGVVGLIFVGARISASPPRSLAAGPATPAFTILAVRWPNKGWSRPLLPDHGELAASEQAQLEAARARRGWRPIRRALSSQFNTSTHRRSSFRFPPRGAASGFRRCFRAASTARRSSFQLSLRSAGSGAQQPPARSSVRLNLKAQLLRRFHRVGPLAAASPTRRCFRRAAPSDARRTMRAGQHRPLQYLNYSTYLQVGLSPSPTQPGLGRRPGCATQAVTSTVTATTAQ